MVVKDQDEEKLNILVDGEVFEVIKMSVYKNDHFEISKIGPLQKLDLLDSECVPIYSKYGRVHRVKKHNGLDAINDDSPIRLSDMFNRPMDSLSNHFIIQVAGCELDCPVCYVDNKNWDTTFNAQDLVDEFTKFKRVVPSLNVFHLMGGNPGRFASGWSILREELNSRTYKNIILLTNVLFIENELYANIPWTKLELDNFVIAGCLKGTNKQNFIDNTGKDYFDVAIKELKNYVKFKNFYLTLLNPDPKSMNVVYNIIDIQRINILQEVRYHASYGGKKND